MERKPEPDVVVIGGGPAGSTAAAMAARAGLSVMLLEAGSHPRPHVGESLLPGIIPILRDIDALAEVEAAGFAHKSGATHHNWGRTPQWDLWFADSDAYDHAWLVERGRFDAIVFDAAKRAGVEVHQHATVTALHWRDDHLQSLTWQPRGGTPRVVQPRLVVDASGARALVANDRELRRPIEGLQHEALWAHWEGIKPLPAPRQQQAYFVAQPRGWQWVFPLANGRTSIGVVRLDRPVLEGTTREYDEAVAQCPEVSALMEEGARRITPVRRERDFSYRVEQVAGPGWLAVGDAAGFIDPVLSTGVHLAMHSGWHAGRTAAAMLREGKPEASADYARHHHEIFDDLLRMVRFYYQHNVHAEDYFWESKRILVRHELALRPAKAFVILTSGLVQNLALQALDEGDQHRRRMRSIDADQSGLTLTPTSPDPSTSHDPDDLGFFCIHLRHADPRDATASPSSIYVLVEPKDPSAPALLRTRNWHINAIAPRHGNDPISVPAFTTTLRGLGHRLKMLDTIDGEPLSLYWRRIRGELVEALRSLPEPFSFVRIFGE